MTTNERLFCCYRNLVRFSTQRITNSRFARRRSRVHYLAMRVRTEHRQVLWHRQCLFRSQFSTGTIRLRHPLKPHPCLNRRLRRLRRHRCSWRPSNFLAFIAAELTNKRFCSLAQIALPKVTELFTMSFFNPDLFALYYLLLFCFFWLYCVLSCIYALSIQY